MVFFTPPRGTEIAAFVAALAKEGVRCSPLAGRIRMVTHLGVSAPEVETAITAVARVVKR
jgi:hypothetical protein